jgi:hypothetical protein
MAKVGYLQTGDPYPIFKHPDRAEEFWNNYEQAQLKKRIAASNRYQDGGVQQRDPLDRAYKMYRQDPTQDAFNFAGEQPTAPPMDRFEQAIGERRKMNMFDRPEERIAQAEAAARNEWKQYMPATANRDPAAEYREDKIKDFYNQTLIQPEERRGMGLGPYEPAWQQREQPPQEGLLAAAGAEQVNDPYFNASNITPEAIQGMLESQGIQPWPAFVEGGQMSPAFKEMVPSPGPIDPKNIALAEALGALAGKAAGGK